MTTQQMVELIRQHHPDIGETEAIMLLNRAKDQLCERVDLLRDKDTSLTTTASTTEYTIPTGTLKVYEVYVGSDQAYRISGRPIIGEMEDLRSETYYYWVERDKIYIVEGGSSTAYTAASLTITIYRSYLDADITTDGVAHTMDMPSRFHEALVDWAIGRGYKRPPMDDERRKNAIFFDKNFEMTLKRAKKYIRSDMQDGGFVVPCDY